MSRDRRIQWRRLTPYAIALGVVLLLVWGFWPTPVLVDAEPVTHGHLALTVEEEGRTRLINRYVVSAPIAAHARRITLEVGDPVQTGDVVAVLEPRAAPALDIRTMAEARAPVAAGE